MKIEKAIFGQVGQGHGLRNCSSNPDFFKKISQWLDLPDVVPAGVDFSPYISGFPFEDKYIISRSFLDKNASRSGMIIVYTIAIDKDVISNVVDLSVLTTLLPAKFDVDNAFIGLNEPSISCNILVDDRDLINSNALQLLIEKNEEPVVHVGLEGFEKLVCSIWARLWPGMRKYFSFRLSISPRDCIEPKIPSLVCIPNSLVSRWRNHNVIKRSMYPFPASPTVDAFNNGYAEFEKFCEIFEIEVKTPSAIGLLLKAKMKYDSRPFIFNDCMALIRFIEVLSPESIKGIESKKTLLKHLASLLNDVSMNEILRLRNFTGVGFGDLKIVWDSLSNKFINSKYSEVDDTHCIEIIKNVYLENNAVVAWKTAVNDGLGRALLIFNSRLLLAIWRWCAINVTSVIHLLDNLEISEDVEFHIASNATKDLPITAVEALVEYFSTKKLLILHGAIVALYYPAKEAFKRQVDIDRDSQDVNGLEIMASFVDQKELLSSCLYVSDDRLTSIVVNRAIDNPLILEGVSFSSNDSLNIWEKALNVNSRLWSAPSKAQDILFLLLDDSLINGPENHRKLISLLSKSPISDLCDYPKVNQIWRVLDDTVRMDFLNETARGWYKRALLQTFISIDAVLEKAIYELQDLKELMARDTIRYCDGIIGIFSRISHFSESDFISWLETWFSVKPELQMDNSQEIGNIILRRKWQKAAQFVLTKNRFYPNSNFILKHCKAVLPLWDRFEMGEITSEERWEILSSLLIELYSSGPNENDIWQRSGGNKWDIWSHGSGFDRWKRAIERVKKGSKPKITDILNEISIDYPNNRKIELLKQIFKD